VAVLVASCFGGSVKLSANAAEKPTIWVVGDSTVSAFTNKYYYPRYGYGTQIANYMDGTFEVKNLALSGRSSKSYVTDTKTNNYETLLAGMKSGDVLIVGFGHNDEKNEEERYTNPNGDYKTAGSFANSLYENYVKPAQEKGATAILCTPIVRRTKTTEWENSQLHITTTNGSFEGGNYPKAIIDMGNTLNIPVVDMTSLTKELYDKLTPSETLYLHAWTTNQSTSVDNTHTNIYGAKYNAYMLTQAIKALNIAGVSEHVKADAVAPTKEADLKPNPDYVISDEPSYDPNLGASALGEKAGIWSPTAFGDLGGSPNKTNLILSSDGKGAYTIDAQKKGGKIGSTADGVVMYYCRVPSNVQFTLTAKATPLSLDSNAQASFGLMARDDMYIDKNDKAIASDYVAAGILRWNEVDKGTAYNCFKRKDGNLEKGDVIKNGFELNKTYDLKIESNEDGYACTFGTEKTITGGFDFQLTSVDSKYVYVGMFTARTAKVTFSDVKLLINGVEVTPENVDELTTYKENTPDDPTPTDVKYGDVNGDGKINIQDGVVIRKHLANMKVTIDTKNSDVNKDGSVDSSDAVLIMKKLAGMNVGF